MLIQAFAPASVRGLQSLRSFSLLLLGKMRILLIGGSGFIGPFVAGILLAQGHDLAIFHRRHRKDALPDGVLHLFGDRLSLTSSRSQFRDFAPDTVIDFILANGRQAELTMDTFHGIASRVVALSSGDVYRAAGILHGIEPGPLQPVPLTEDSDLRSHGQTYPKEVLAALHQIFPWLENDYDKIPMEQVIMGDRELAGTVLRLPMVYGPGDPLHRLHPYLKRMDDGRSAILIQEDAAEWRGPRGYVENVAAAISLAATSPQAAGRIYNFAEPERFSEIEWARHIARSVGWTGAVLPVPTDLTPAHLKVPYNSAQHWTMSSARIRHELGFAEVVSSDAAIARTIEWERANPPAQLNRAQFDYPAEDAAFEQLRLREKIALSGA
jgi:nucleoside-diphosphate-sugar epimerase